MICKLCGYEAESECKFCPKCGLRIEPYNGSRELKFTSSHGWIETEDSFICPECGREYKKGQLFCLCGYFKEYE